MGADSGSAPDDAGEPLDAGPAVDAGDPLDAGPAADAGEPLDAGPAADAGEPLDAGGAVDGGDVGDGGPPVLAPAADEAEFFPVDGISCETSEQLLFHIHAHLDIFVDGGQELVAAGIGIGPPLTYDSTGFVTGGSCFSWLHTHDTSGIIHIESPIQRTYTLGNFFDIWGLPLSSAEVGPATGPVSAFLNGAPFTGDLTTIPLDAYNVIQLDVGTPVVAAQPYTFPAGY